MTRARTLLVAAGILCASVVGSAGGHEAAPVNGQILFGVAWPERLDWRDESPKERQVEVCGSGTCVVDALRGPSLEK